MAILQIHIQNWLKKYPKKYLLTTPKQAYTKIPFKKLPTHFVNQSIHLKKD